MDNVGLVMSNDVILVIQYWFRMTSPSVENTYAPAVNSAANVCGYMMNVT